MKVDRNTLDFVCTSRQYQACVAYEKIMLINEVTGKRTIYRRKKKKNEKNNKAYPNVKIYASKKGIRLLDIAAALEVDYSALCSMLNGTRRLKPELKPRIASLLRVSEEVLFGVEE